MQNNQREQQHLGIVDSLLMQMFGRPKGVLGRLGGFILARTKRDFTQWVIHLLDVQLKLGKKAPTPGANTVIRPKLKVSTHFQGNHIKLRNVSSSI